MEDERHVERKREKESFCSLVSVCTAVSMIARQLNEMMGTDWTKVSNFVRHFCRPCPLTFC